MNDETMYDINLDMELRRALIGKKNQHIGKYLERIERFYDGKLKLKNPSTGKVFDPSHFAEERSLLESEARRWRQRSCTQTFFHTKMRCGQQEYRKAYSNILPCALRHSERMRE